MSDHKIKEVLKLGNFSTELMIIFVCLIHIIKYHSTQYMKCKVLMNIYRLMKEKYEIIPNGMNGKGLLTSLTSENSPVPKSSQEPC